MLICSCLFSALNATGDVDSTPDWTRTHTHIFLVERVTFHSYALCNGSRCFRVKRVRVIILCSHSSHSLMSLLNIPDCSFSQVLSSPTCSRSRPSAATTWEEASGKNAASPLVEVGCLAEWLTQLQKQLLKYLVRLVVLRILSGCSAKSTAKLRLRRM